MLENLFPLLNTFFIKKIKIICFVLVCISLKPQFIWGQDKKPTSNEQTKLLTYNTYKPVALAGETLMDLVVEDKKTIASNSFVLYQNTPNPFYEVTTVVFELYENTDLTLTVYDPEGKVLKEYKGSFEKGKNKIQVAGKDLKDFGILYYQITTPTQILSKKMIYKKPSKT